MENSHGLRSVRPRSKWRYRSLNYLRRLLLITIYGFARVCTKEYCNFGGNFRNPYKKNPSKEK